MPVKPQGMIPTQLGMMVCTSSNVSGDHGASISRHGDSHLGGTAYLRIGKPEPGQESLAGRSEQLVRCAFQW